MTIKEIEQGLTELGVDNKETMIENIKLADTDNSGELDWREFLELAMDKERFLSKEFLQGTCAESLENKWELMIPRRAAVLAAGLGPSWDPGEKVLRSGTPQET